LCSRISVETAVNKKFNFRDNFVLPTIIYKHYSGVNKQSIYDKMNWMKIR